MSSVGHFVWVEVDPQKAYEKACQALREGAPEIRRKMKSSSASTGGGDDDDGSDAEQGTDQGKERAATGTASAGKDESVPTQQPGERMQETEETKKPGDAKVAETSKQEPSDDDRNDEMEDSERS